MILRFTSTILLMLSSCLLKAQSHYQLSGKVIDEQKKVSLLYATVIVDDTVGISANEFGEFSIRLSKGKHNVKVTFMGYETFQRQVDIQQNYSLVVNMNPQTNKLKEFIVAERKSYGEEKIEKSQMSSISLKPKDINLLPSLIGEPDPIKVAQLLPGISKGVEGSSDMFVRGGDADQNLVLLDGSTVYNTGHLFGFMSVFNPDAIGEVTMMNGAFPAYYGGRLSSILDITTDEEMSDSSIIKGSVGIVSSRFTVKKPLLKKKMSVLLAARRTYIDQVLKVVNAEVQLPYYFYDVNGRINYNLNEKNKLYLSAYYGADILDLSRSRREEEDSNFQSNFNLANNSQSIGWKHIITSKKSTDLTVSRTKYAYQIDNSFDENGIDLSSGIEDYAGDFKYKIYRIDSSNLTLGSSFVYHNISPAVLNAKGIVESLISSTRSRSLSTLEGAFYGQYEKNFLEKFRLTVGFRQSYAFSGINLTQGISYDEFYTEHEPRVSVRYKLSGVSALKASYSRMVQYMHRVSSSSVTLPTDVWYTITKSIKPQTANQFALGYTRIFPEQDAFLSLEGYYKNMNNLTEYEEGTNLILNTEFEERLIQGKGDSYGVELLLRREHKRLQGWIAYTLSWTNRYFEQLNNGNSFPAKYDRRHNVAIVGIYKLTSRLAFSAVWEYLSGSRFTPIIGQYTVFNPGNTGIDLIPIYSERNAVALSDAHRLDIGITLKSKSKKKFRSEWKFSVYNVYNRATPVSINIVNENGSYKYLQPGLFGLLPSVAYSFEF